jgi:3-hydroxyisobutyrate dehydrogenase-like beta-hydroxyacid dehydrogenase
MAYATKIGLIGLGLVGEALAYRLIDAGYEVVGYDVDAARARHLESFGGHALGSIEAVAFHADRVLISVFDTAQVIEVVEGKGGLIASGNRWAACHSTCDPDQLAALTARAAKQGLALLEVPLSGTNTAIRRGDGVALVGGSWETTAEFDDVLKVICPRRFTLGAVGNASRAKLVVNLVLGLNRAGLAEGLALAERLGLDPISLLEVLKGSSAYSQVMDIKGQKMVQREFQPEAKVVQSLKDAHVMLDQAKAVGQPLPLTAIATALLQACVAHGEGELDNSIVVEEIRRRRKKKPAS